jgi:hypothetical protein
MCHTNAYLLKAALLSLTLMTSLTLVEGQIVFESDSKSVVQPQDLSKQQITFPFVNKGKANVIISKIIPSCGCTIATATPAIIGPGEGGKVSLHLTARKQPGSIVNVIVQFNSKTMPPIMLSLKIAEPPPSIDEQLKKMGLSINPSNDGVTKNMLLNVPFIIRISKANDLVDLDSLNLITNCANISIIKSLRVNSPPLAACSFWWPGLLVARVVPRKRGDKKRIPNTPLLAAGFFIFKA